MGINNNGFDSVPVVLVGNKTDLHMERMIPAEEGKKLAETWKAVFLETSAKQNAVSLKIMYTLRLHVLVHFLLFFSFSRCRRYFIFF